MPPTKENISTVAVVNPICCGLDVHKETVVACLMLSNPDGREQTEQREFPTFTDALVSLRNWLVESDCPVVGIESTGVYWQSVHNTLEGYLKVVLVNPKHTKNLPGRKTDMSDSRWLAGLLRHGLVRGSFIPPQQQRQWREMTRLRKSYLHTLGDFKRMVHALFHRANIKIDSVVSDLFGMTGRNLMQLLATNHSDLTLSDVRGCLCGSLREKADELYRSVQGFFGHHHRRLLTMLLETIATLESQIAQLEGQIQESMNDQAELLERMREVPGIGETASHSILAEAGPSLEDFVTAAAFVSWCGLCPGNNQSAGKRRSGRTRVVKNHLKTLMVEVAWGAVHTRGSYYRDKYYRLKGRLGPKKAIVAIAHRILKALYHIIKNGDRFKELGEKFLAEQNRDAKLKYLKKQAALLGHELIPSPKQIS